jgi:hypothetical protein
MTNYEGKIKLKNIWIFAHVEPTRVDEDEGEATTVAADPNGRLQPTPMLRLTLGDQAPSEGAPRGFLLV